MGANFTLSLTGSVEAGAGEGVEATG